MIIPANRQKMWYCKRAFAASPMHTLNVTTIASWNLLVPLGLSFGAEIEKDSSVVSIQSDDHRDHSWDSALFRSGWKLLPWPADVRASERTAHPWRRVLWRHFRPRCALFPLVQHKFISLSTAIALRGLLCQKNQSFVHFPVKP